MLALANTKKTRTNQLKEAAVFPWPSKLDSGFFTFIPLNDLKNHPPCWPLYRHAPSTMLPCALLLAPYAIHHEPYRLVLWSTLPCVISHALRAMPPYAMPPCAMLHAALASHIMPFSSGSFIQTQSLPKRLIPTVIAKQLSKSISLGWLLLLRGWYCLFACHYMSFC